jgi:hypothetical protein
MKTVNWWLSLVFGFGLGMLFSVLWDWGFWFTYLVILILWGVFYLMGMSNIIDMDNEERIATQEAENRELINKALKHYAETKGIK